MHGVAGRFAQVRDTLGVGAIATAYGVQQEVTRRSEAAGAVVVGRKIGLTSPAVQQQLSVDQPDFGVLFANMDVSGGPEVPSDRLLQPKAEGEIAFIISDDSVEGALDDAQVRAAVGYAVAALEIVDSRMAICDISTCPGTHPHTGDRHGYPARAGSPHFP